MRRFNDKYGERRGIGEISLNLFHRVVSLFIRKLFDGFSVFKEYDLLRRKHRQRPRLIQHGLNALPLRGKMRERPGSRSLRDVLIDQLRAAEIAQVRLFAKKQNRRYRLRFFQLKEKFVWTDRH